MHAYKSLLIDGTSGHLTTIEDDVVGVMFICDYCPYLRYKDLRDPNFVGWFSPNFWTLIPSAFGSEVSVVTSHKICPNQSCVPCLKVKAVFQCNYIIIILSFMVINATRCSKGITNSAFHSGPGEPNICLFHVIVVLEIDFELFLINFRITQPTILSEKRSSTTVTPYR